MRAFNQDLTPFFSDSMKYRAISNSSIQHRSSQQYEGHRIRAYTHASQMPSASNEKPLGAMPLAWRNTSLHTRVLDLLRGSMCVLTVVWLFPMCVCVCVLFFFEVRVKTEHVHDGRAEHREVEIVRHHLRRAAARDARMTRKHKYGCTADLCETDFKARC